MSKWPTVALGTIAEINPRQIPFPDDDNVVAFVPMSELDSQTGATSLGISRPYAEVAKGYTPFKNGDILLAKITPCFENMKIGQAKLSHEFGVGSTEFHVLRAAEDQLDARYLLHFLRRGEILRRGELRMTGSGGQKRVPTQFLSALEIPLPPLEEQHRIAAILDQAKAQLDNVRKAILLLERAPQALFQEMFSGKTLELVPLGKLIAEHQLGLDKKSSELGSDRMHRYLKMDSITSNGDLDMTRVTRADCSEEEAEKYSLRDGDLIFNTRNARNLVGKSTIYRGPVTLFNNNLLRLRFVDDVLPDFVHQFLWSESGRRQLDSRKSGTTSVWAIYFKSLKTVQIPVPSMDEQRRFTCRLSSIRGQVNDYRRLERLIEEFLDSLQSRAFRGEL